MRKIYIITIILLIATTLFLGIKLINLKSELDNLFSEKQCIQISDSKDHNMFATVKGDTVSVFIDYMEEKGWKYIPEEQLGGGYCFEKDGNKVYYTCTNYKNYYIWYS